MLMGSLKVRKWVAVMTLALAGFTSPVFADGVAECYGEVIENCDDALDVSNWFEKIAVGLVCAGMLAGCGFEAF